MRRTLNSLLIAALLPYGTYAISNTKFEKVPDHTHTEVKSTHDDHHEHDGEDHSHSYTHSHGEGQPEHTHHDSHNHEMVTCGFVFDVVTGAVEIVHAIVAEETFIFPEASSYIKPNLDSIFRPPIA